MLAFIMGGEGLTCSGEEGQSPLLNLYIFQENQIVSQKTTENSSKKSLFHEKSCTLIKENAKPPELWGLFKFCPHLTQNRVLEAVKPREILE